MDHSILDQQLKTMGFDTEEMAGFATVIRYEGLSILNFWEADDENFLRLALPRFYDVTDENRALLLDIANRINIQLKYTKVCVEDDALWAYYEHYVTSETDLETLLEHSIRCLQATLFTFHHYVNGDEQDNDEDEEDGTISTSDNLDDLDDVTGGERSVLEEEHTDVLDEEQ